MKLTLKGLEEAAAWQEKGYHLPSFDRQTVEKNTKENPFWIHFGAGNIFRAFQANVVQTLLENGTLNRGLVVAEGYDYEIISKMYTPHDNLSILATLKASGTVEKTIVGSIMESLILDSKDADQFARLKEIFKKDSLQMASFTITEKGYALKNAAGELFPAIAEDIKTGPVCPESYLGKVAALLFARFEAGEKPIAMVSMDNCSHNGDKLNAAMTAFAEGWVANGLAPAAFLSYIKDSAKVSFPWSMIDKITPRPDPSVEAMLAKDGIEELAPVITSKSTYVAPFVNAEECEYLVIEDAFPNGRPALEKGGIIFTDRETVDKVEKMKVCTCLNPLHTTLAVYGCLLGYTLIADEMKDTELKKMVETIGYKEGLPVVVNPGILDPKEFIDAVLTLRIPNPFMPDTPQRIATDTSQKLSIRFGETIKAYINSSTLEVNNLKLIPLVYAGWVRYLLAVDDNGNTFELSPDPLLESVCPMADRIRPTWMGGTNEALTASALADSLKDLLGDARIFGVDLYEAGLSDMVCSYLAELLEGPGAIRRTLQKYV